MLCGANVTSKSMYYVFDALECQLTAFAARTLLHHFLPFVVGQKESVYMAGTRFDFGLIWRIVSALHSMAAATARVWMHFPEYDLHDVKRMLSAVLLHPPPDHVLALLTGRGRFCCGLLEHIVALWLQTSSESPAQQVLRLSYQWYNTIVKLGVAELRFLVQPDTAYESNLVAYYICITLGNTQAPLVRGGIVPLDFPAEFVKIIQGDNSPALRVVHRCIEPIFRATLEDFMGLQPLALLRFFLVQLGSAPTPQAAASSLDLLTAVLLKQISSRYGI